MNLTTKRSGTRFATITLGLALLGGSAFAQYSIENLHENSTDVGEGWRQHPDFGYYSHSSDNWVYHDELGWLYVWAGEGGETFWWNEDTGLSYSQLESAYPWTYNYRLQDWVFFGGKDEAGDLSYTSVSGRPGSQEQVVPGPALRPESFPSKANASKFELGRLLFFDKILSGNQNISCATCHHPAHGTGDGLSLPVGEGGVGLGPARTLGTGEARALERGPRSAPTVWNLASDVFVNFFFDGRLALDDSQPSGFLNPAGDDLPEGLEGLLAAQAMFPVQAGAEMAGHAGESSIGDAAAVANLAGPGGVWEQLSQRVAAVPRYAQLMRGAYPDEVEGPNDITMVHIANAIGTFEGEAFRADGSPYDRYLAGNLNAMSADAIAGLQLFYGKANCSECHNGPLLTDEGFHAIAMPQIGPGKGDGPSTHEDFGRERVTGDAEDRFKFRTTSLRNVALNAPYGHAGAYASLRDVVLHHLDPVNSLEAYDATQAVMPSRADLDAIDSVVMADAGLVNAIAAANEIAPVDLSEAEMSQLLAFLNALTDPASENADRFVPRGVPSGLPVAD